MKTIALTIIVALLYVLFSGSIFITTEKVQNITYLSNKQKILEVRMKPITKKKYSKNYELTIQFIKKHEGFNDGYTYICPGGHTTIGHGHIIMEGEEFPEQISKIRADRLLRSDFNKALRLCDKYTDLKGSKRFAIAHLIFAKGIGNYLDSDLRILIDNNEPIDDEILNWSYYYKPDGTKVKSEFSYKIRMWELEMYNK